MERMTVELVTGEAPPPPRGCGFRVLGLAGLVLLVVGLWVRGLPAFVAWVVAGDHQRCFGRRQLPARVWSSDPAEVRDWLESHGTPTPILPSEAGTAEIAGARYCAVEDRVAAHVYYAGQGGTVSVFLLAGPARIGDGWSGRARGLHVRLLRAVGRYVAVVGESAADVAATARAFEATVARAPSVTVPCSPACRVDRPRSSC